MAVTVNYGVRTKFESGAVSKAFGDLVGQMHPTWVYLPDKGVYRLSVVRADGEVAFTAHALYMGKTRAWVRGYDLKGEVAVENSFAGKRAAMAAVETEAANEFGPAWDQVNLKARQAKAAAQAKAKAAAAKVSNDLEAMKQATTDTLSKIAGGPVTVRFAADLDDSLPAPPAPATPVTVASLPAPQTLTAGRFASLEL